MESQEIINRENNCISTSRRARAGWNPEPRTDQFRKKFDPWAFQIILLKQVISSRIATLLVGIRSISEVNLGVSGLLEKGLAIFILELNGP